MERKAHWPETIIVFDNGGGWSGFALPAGKSDAENIETLERILRSMHENGVDAEELLQSQAWRRATWDDEAGEYKYENGKPTGEIDFLEDVVIE